MFENIFIKNFRGITELKIDDLKTINLFVGENDCGKTSILEAILLLTRQSNPQLLFNLNHDRGMNFFTPGPFLISYFRDLNSKNTIEINGMFKYSLQSEAIQRNLQINLTEKGIEYKFNDQNGQEFKLYLTSFSSKYHEDVSGTFISSNLLYNNFIDEQFDYIVKHNQKEKIINVLKEIEPSITDMKISNDDGTMYFELNSQTLIPVNTIGNGILKLFFIIISIYSNKDGVVIIDEIEDGIYYKNLKILWKNIIKASEEFNVQIFANTHSYECIESLFKSYEEEKLNNDFIRVFRIEKNKNLFNAIKYDSDILKTTFELFLELR